MDKEEPTPRFGKARSLLFALTPLLALLLVTEAVLRLGSFRLEVPALRVEASDNYAVRMFESLLASEHFVADPVTFWKPKPGYPPFNALGYRGDELTEEKADGELRILAVGDSNTLGSATSSWVNEIASTDSGPLRRRRITVVNAGVYGYTSYQGRHHLKRFLYLRPDVVLIAFGGNESTRNKVADKDYVPYVPHPFYAFFGRRLAVVNLMEYLSVKLALWRHPRTPSSQELVSRVSLSDYEDDLQTMIEAARAAGAQGVLVTRPLADDYHAPESTNNLKPYYESTLALGERVGVPVIDLDVMADHSWVLFADHSHFNVEGHRLMGKYVRALLAKILAGKDVGKVPRFHPRNRDERATHVVGRKAQTWLRLEENLAKLRRDPRIEKLTPVYESDFTEGSEGWRVTARGAKDFTPVPRDGALCFPGDVPAVTLERQELGLDESWPHFVWIEARSRSDVAFQLSWSLRDGFDPARTAGATFFRRDDEPVFRFFSTLPAGTRDLRLDFVTLHREGDVCLEKIYIAELVVPGRPASTIR